VPGQHQGQRAGNEEKLHAVRSQFEELEQAPMHVGDEVLDVGRDHPGDREPSQRVDIRQAAGDHPTEAAAPYSFSFR
jgi:hypothetical protein